MMDEILLEERINPTWPNLCGECSHETGYHNANGCMTLAGEDYDDDGYGYIVPAK